MKSALLVIALLLVPELVVGEIYKLAVPTDKGMSFFWWPVLPPLPGWEHDEGASRAQGVNALVPIGVSFSTAPAIIYARAIFKPRSPETKSLTQLIEGDRATFMSDFPGTAIKELASISDADGREHPYLSYTPSAKGNWERVAYGEEGDFYLIFTVSGNSKAALENARKDFEQMISRYKEKP